MTDILGWELPPLTDFGVVTDQRCLRRTMLEELRELYIENWRSFLRSDARHFC